MFKLKWFKALNVLLFKLKWFKKLNLLLFPEKFALKHRSVGLGEGSLIRRGLLSGRTPQTSSYEEMEIKTFFSCFLILEQQLDFNLFIWDCTMQRALSMNTLFFFSLLRFQTIPDICHFFTRTKFLENKIYTEKTRK